MALRVLGDGRKGIIQVPSVMNLERWDATKGLRPVALRHAGVTAAQSRS